MISCAQLNPTWGTTFCKPSGAPTRRIYLSSNDKGSVLRTVSSSIEFNSMTGKSISKSAVFATVFLALAFTQVSAQNPAPILEVNSEVPRNAIAKIRPILSKIRETQPEVIERKIGEFLKTKEIASDIRAYPSTTDFTDKPFEVRIRWTSNIQETKIYSEKGKAEKSKDWLPIGKIAGSKANSASLPESYTAVLFFIGKKWVLDEITWFSSLDGISLPNGYAARIKSTKSGDKTRWSYILSPGAESKINLPE